MGSCGRSRPRLGLGCGSPPVLFADRELLAAIEHDHSLEQLANVATLPGIVEAALAMPDIHQGYGFPVGGVAATEPPEGVVSPGGVGYDINCGVRLLALPIGVEELGDRRKPLVHELSRRVPLGTGGRGSRRGSQRREPGPGTRAGPSGAARRPGHRWRRRAGADGVRRLSGGRRPRGGVRAGEGARR